MTDPSGPPGRRHHGWPTPPPSVMHVGAAIHHAEHRVRPDFRRAVLAGGLSLVFLIVGVDLGGVKRHGDIRWVIIGLTVGFVALAVLAIRSIARQLNRMTEQRAGLPAASALRTISLMIGAIFVLLGVMELLDVNLREVLLGGAITGVIVGIAAQQPLGNFFAGLVLLFARPYVPGEKIRIHCGAIGGPFDGRIIYGGLMYSVLETETGRLNIPNLQLMTAAIGPAVDDASPPSAPETSTPDAQPDSDTHPRASDAQPIALDDRTRDPSATIEPNTSG